MTNPTNRQTFPDLLGLPRVTVDELQDDDDEYIVVTGTNGWMHCYFEDGVFFIFGGNGCFANNNHDIVAIYRLPNAEELT